MFISFPLGAPEANFVVSGVVCVVNMHFCWEGAARLFLKCSCHLVSWTCGFASNRPVASLTPTSLHVRGFPASGFVIWYNPYPTAFPYGNGMVLHFYQQQESSTTKTVHKVINKGLKAYV